MSIEILIGYLILFAGISLVIFYGIPIVVPIWLKHIDQKVSTADSLLSHSFIFIDKKRLFLICAVAAAIVAVIGFMILGNIIGAVAGLLVGAIIPPFVAKVVKQRRQIKFIGQLNDVLMIISSSLRGGLSLVQAAEAVTEDMEKPASDEFSLMIREIKMGVSLEDALKRLGERMPSEEIDLIVSAILVSRETGGDLIKTFKNLVTTMRDKARVKEMISTLTLQAKIQGFVMFALPFVFISVVLKSNPQHFDPFFQTDLGKMLLVAACVVELIAMFFIYIFSKIEA
ncbi:MAG: type II secretion system F family protein [Candidatus Omnitrophica bacterium]|nr:type II secretion system F family protein [Candidatus Omnitrophota bacterium]